MSNVGQRERLTQDRVVKFFREELDYDYLGDWQDREGNRNIETVYLRRWSQSRCFRLRQEALRSNNGWVWECHVVYIKHAKFRTCSVIQTLKISA